MTELHGEPLTPSELDQVLEDVTRLVNVHRNLRNDVQRVVDEATKRVTLLLREERVSARTIGQRTALRAGIIEIENLVNQVQRVLDGDNDDDDEVSRGKLDDDELRSRLTSTPSWPTS